MSVYITVDGGTTNTRINLVDDLNIVDTLKFNIGARLCRDNKPLLEDTLRNGIAELIKRNTLKENNIQKILVSGMLTSEFGLLNLKHIIAPAGIEELHNSMAEATFETISSIPFVFIRGVRMPDADIDGADMMRGEECELFGLIDEKAENVAYLLPGSHSKIIITDNQGKIIKIITTLTGEMISSISSGTILKDAIDLDNSELNDESLLFGYNYCCENGINKALFKTRVMKNIFSKSNSDVYSFFMGVILRDEICEILKLNPEKLIIGGKQQIKEAIYKILTTKLKNEILIIPEEKVEAANSVGMVKIFEYKKRFKT